MQGRELEAPAVTCRLDAINVLGIDNAASVEDRCWSAVNEFPSRSSGRWPVSFERFFKYGWQFLLAVRTNNIARRECLPRHVIVGLGIRRRFLWLCHFSGGPRTPNICMALSANRCWSALAVYFSASLIVSQPKIAIS